MEEIELSGVVELLALLLLHIHRLVVQSHWQPGLLGSREASVQACVPLKEIIVFCNYFC
jgi:hypothetical protein